jgi:hypothetical protein
VREFSAAPVKSHQEKSILFECVETRACLSRRQMCKQGCCEISPGQVEIDVKDYVDAPQGGEASL